MSKLDELLQQYCPNGVEYKPLLSVSDVLYGYPCDAKKFNSDGVGFPLARIRDVLSGWTDTYTSEMVPDIYRLHSGDLLIGMDGNFHVAIWKMDGAVLCQRVCKLSSSDTSIMLNGWLNHLMKPIIKQIEDSKQSGTVKHLLANDLKKIVIPVPPLPVQQEIVRILDKFTELEAELEAELLLRKKQYEWYRDQLLTLPSADAPILPWLQRLLDYYAPNGVEWKTLGDVCDLVTGATPSTSVSRYWDGGTIPWMSSGEVNLKQVFKTEQYITQAGYEVSSTTLVPAHSVVIALAGQGKTRGKVAVTEIELCTNQSLCSMICHKELNYRFLFYILDSQYERLRSISNGDGTRGGLSLRILKPYLIPVPSLEIQEAIVSVLDKFSELCTDIFSGLPAEITARQKQYEYYRDKLLSFEPMT